MDEPRFYQRPWFYIFSWSVILGGIYLWQVRSQGGILANVVTILIDGIIFIIGLLVWLAFFAQFVLPVRSFRERQQIFDRLRTYMGGGHGPAIFIENGVPRERQGESKKKGPGVLWLDSASAAVTRTATSFKQVLGPGVHFTESKETLAGYVDLHRQAQKLGPSEEDRDYIFASSPGKDVDDKEIGRYEQVQKRRLEVSAWTRDGVEVVPNISVTFQIDADPAVGKAPGSHFANLDPFKSELPEENPVFKAIVGEAINPKATGDTRKVAWNELPARIAVDLWREYLAKFTLWQLFEAEQEPLPGPAAPAGLIPSETQALYQPSSIVRGGMLHELNTILARWADRCEAGGKEAIRVRPEIPKPVSSPPPNIGTEKVTALQIINSMVNARMKQSKVVELDDQGRLEHTKQPLDSKEYAILKGRGLRIHSVGISNIKLNPSVEEELVRQWKATWLQNAKAEKAQVDRLRSFAEIQAQVEGNMEYAVSLGKSLEEEKPQAPKATIRTLLLRSRNELVKNDRFHRQAGMERETLEEIIQWVERNGK